MKYNVFAISNVGTTRQEDTLLLQTDDFEEAKRTARYDLYTSSLERNPETYSTEIRVYTNFDEYGDPCDYDTIDFLGENK